MNRFSIYLLFIFVICSCGGTSSDDVDNIDDQIPLEETLNMDEEAQDSKQELKNLIEELKNLSLDELKEKAIVFTFEDIRSIVSFEPDIVDHLYHDVEEGSVIWLKDFKNWKLKNLTEGQIQDFSFVFRFHYKDIHEDSRTPKLVYIDDDGIINHFTVEQLKDIIKETYHCLSDEHNYYPVDYMKHLTDEELDEMKTCLTEEQVLAEKDRLNPQFMVTYDGKIPFSPEYIRSLGDRVTHHADCRFFQSLNKEQVQGLAPEQINVRPLVTYYDGTTDYIEVDEGVWCWKRQSHKWGWLTPDQIKQVDFEKETFVEGYAKDLNKEQLKVLSKDQLSHLGFKQSGFFSTEQLQVLKKNGATNDVMNNILFYREMGPDVFTEHCPWDNLKECWDLFEYLVHLDPEQFSSLRKDQALSMDFRLPILLTPEQISYVPYFVEILNFDWYNLTRKVHAPYVLRYSTGKIKKYILYTTSRAPISEDRIYRLYLDELKRLSSSREHFNHARLLTNDQLMAIQADQMKYFPTEELRLIFIKNLTPERMNSNYRGDPKPLPFTPEQVAQISFEKFKVIFSINNYHGRDLLLEFLTEEFVEVLSLDKINYIYDDLLYREDYDKPVIKKMLDRKSKLETMQ